MKNVVFLLTAHAADDERVWRHQRPSLQRRGCPVTVVAPHTAHETAPEMLLYDREGLSRRQLMRHLATLLEQLHPDVLIGDTPLSLRSAQLYRRKSGKSCRILYDITEWYPSKKNVRNLPPLKKMTKKALLALFNIWTNLRTDGFVFGEADKARPFRLLFPKRPFVFTSYYPDLEYVPHYPTAGIDDGIRLFYSGNLTEEKGFPRVLATASRVAEQNPQLKVVLRIASAEETALSGEYPANLVFEKYPFLPFDQFCKTAAECDLFLDLRDDDAENRRCLPIKLFYYMAMARPVVYSDLTAIRTGCPEILSFGHLVNPHDVDATANCIQQYLQEHALYQEHCTTARNLACEKYNWSAIENDFVKFILEI